MSFVCFVVVKSVDDRFRITTKYTKVKTYSSFSAVGRKKMLELVHDPEVVPRCTDGVKALSDRHLFGPGISGVANVAVVTALPAEDLNCHSNTASPNFTLLR